jgi:hypothetical protein
LYFTVTGVNNGNPVGTDGTVVTGIGTGPGSGGAGITGSGFLDATCLNCGPAGPPTPYTGEYLITGGYGITINNLSATVIPITASTPAVGGGTVGGGTGCSSGTAGSVCYSPYNNGNGFTYDDLIDLSTSPNYVDNQGGLLLQLTGTNEQVEISYFGGDLLEEYDTGLQTYNSASAYGYDITLDAELFTPEPSSWLLFGTGLFLMAGFVFWKAKQDTPMASMNRAV